MPPVDVTSPIAGAEKLSAALSNIEKQAATVAAIRAQVAPFTEATEKLSANIAKQMAPLTEAMEKLSANFANIAKQVARYVAKMAPRRQPHRSHRRSSGRTSARRTRRSGAARALSRLADDPAEPAPGSDAGLVTLSLAVVGGLDTLPAYGRVIA